MRSAHHVCGEELPVASPRDGVSFIRAFMKILKDPKSLTPFWIVRHRFWNGFLIENVPVLRHEEEIP